MGSRQPLLSAYLLSVVAVVAAAIGSLVLMETATIKMSVPTSRVVAEKTIIGAQSGRDLTTARIAADVTDTQQGTATTAVTSPTYATGTVQFTCSPCPADGIPVGTVVSTAAGTRYETQLRGPIGPPNNGVSVLVRAVLAGKGGNTAANTVTMIVPPMPNVKVTNAAAITGGADAVVNTGITQSDLDSVRSALSAKVTQELIVSLTVQAGGLNFAPDGQPDLAVTTDHKIGEKVATFTMTMEGKLGAVAFSESQADTIMRTTLGDGCHRAERHRRRAQGPHQGHASGVGSGAARASRAGYDGRHHRQARGAMAAGAAGPHQSHDRDRDRRYRLSPTRDLGAARTGTRTFLSHTGGLRSRCGRGVRSPSLSSCLARAARACSRRHSKDTRSR